MFSESPEVMCEFITRDSATALYAFDPRAEGLKFILVVVKLTDCDRAYIGMWYLIGNNRAIHPTPGGNKQFLVSTERVSN